MRTEYPVPLTEIERQLEEDGSWEGDLVQTTKDGRSFTALDQAAATPVAPVTIRRPSTSSTVLIVEDEPALRDLTARTVSAIGYTVLTAGGIAGALEIARDLTKEIDLLLTDVVMPDVLGQELAAQRSSCST